MTVAIHTTRDDLSGRVALVTGGGRGIGRAIALSLAVAGASVAVAARSADQVAATAALIDASGGRADRVRTMSRTSISESIEMPPVM